MADVSSKILKIRTFADDVKRAGGDTAFIPPSVPAPQNSLAPAVVSSLATATSTPSTPSTSSQKTTPTAIMPSAPVPAPVPGSAFDIRHEERGVGGEVTILSDRPSRSANILQTISVVLTDWFREHILPLIASETPTPSIAHTTLPTIAPAQSTRTSDSTRTFAQAVADAQNGKAPEATQAMWRSISEPRVRQASISAPTEVAEALAHRQALQKALVPQTPTQPKNPFKAARPIRMPTAPMRAPDILPPIATVQAIPREIVPETTPPVQKKEEILPVPVIPPQVFTQESVSPTPPVASVAEKEAYTPLEHSAHARLKKLVESETLTSPAPEERLHRDIPFVPPPVREASAAPVRTFRFDALSDIKTQELSKTRIASAERERSERTGIPLHVAPQAKKPFPFLLVASSALSVVLFIALGVSLYPRLTAPKTDATPLATKAFTIERTENLSLPSARTEFLAALTNIQQQTSLTKGEFLEITPRISAQDGSREATADEVFRTLDPRAPSAFLRTQTRAPLFGLYDTSRTPFVVLSVTNFETAFAGMLAWETNMSIDMMPFLGDPVRRTYDAGSLTIDQTREAHFVDTVIQNVDVRILYDENGAGRILYAFPDPQTIIITTTPEALTALIQELR